MGPKEYNLTYVQDQQSQDMQIIRSRQIKSTFSGNLNIFVTQTQSLLQNKKNNENPTKQ